MEFFELFIAPSAIQGTVTILILLLVALGGKQIISLSAQHFYFFLPAFIAFVLVDFPACYTRMAEPTVVVVAVLVERQTRSFLVVAMMMTMMSASQTLPGSRQLAIARLDRGHPLVVEYPSSRVSNW